MNVSAFALVDVHTLTRAVPSIQKNFTIARSRVEWRRYSRRERLLARRRRFFARRHRAAARARHHGDAARHARSSRHATYPRKSTNPLKWLGVPRRRPRPRDGPERRPRCRDAGGVHSDGSESAWANASSPASGSRRRPESTPRRAGGARAARGRRGRDSSGRTDREARLAREGDGRVNPRDARTRVGAVVAPASVGADELPAPRRRRAFLRPARVRAVPSRHPAPVPSNSLNSHAPRHIGHRGASCAFPLSHFVMHWR